MQKIKILVYVECRAGSVHPVSMELIGEALRLSASSGGYVFAAAAGSDMSQVQEQMRGCGLTRLYLYDTVDEYEPVHYERIMINCIKDCEPDIVLIGGTLEGRALAPGLAVTFKTGLTADCTSLELNEKQELVQTRPAFGGNIMASILTKSRPQFATVRPHVMEAVQPQLQNESVVVQQHVEFKADKIRVTKVEEEKRQTGIANQKLLVVAGRGIRKKEDIEMLRELAGLLGGKLASSRALVEKGWMRPEEQIGLSGSTVSPQYMILFGVSGTVQFMAGMKNTKNIIAVNTDANARIFDIAHYPVCGDLYEIVPEMIERLKKKGDGKSET